MRKRVHVRSKRLLMIVLSFALIWGTLFSMTTAFAEEGAGTTPTLDSISTPSVTGSTYGNENSGGTTVVNSSKPPQNLHVEKLAHNVATLAWDFIPNEDPNDMQVYRASDGQSLAWGNLWTRVVAGLKPQTTYSVFIAWEKDKQGNGLDIPEDRRSNVITFTTPENTDTYEPAPVTPPQYLKVAAVTEKSVILSWGGSSNANGYDLYVNGSWIKGIWDGTNQVSYTIPEGTAVGTSFTFQVGAQYAEAGQATRVSKNSNAVAIKWGQLDAPKSVQPLSATRTSVVLGWAPTPGATEYDVYEAGTRIGSTAENRYVAEGLTTDHTYSYTVVARNSHWSSAASEPIEAIPGHAYNIVTYYASWARSETGRNYKPADVDYSKFTRINYAFTDLCWQKIGTYGKPCQDQQIPLQKNYVHDGEMIISDPDNDLPNLSEFMTIKAEHPELKLLASAGGWSWSDNFSHMAATEVTRQIFANSVVEFLREYQFDGIDIDWEYPVEGGEEGNAVSPDDKQNFTLMTEAVRQALDAAGSEDGKYYLFTIAAGQADNFIVNADLANAAKNLDAVNLMTYDYSGSWDPLAHHNSPVFADRDHPLASNKRNNVQGAALAFMEGGVPNYKVIVGIPFYGKGWAGCPEDNNGQYQVCSGATSFGTYEEGSFDYQDLEANYINKNGYTAYWNDASKVAYLYNPDTKVFITYNDLNSMKYTAAMVKSLDVAGVMSWEAHGDKNTTLSKELVKDLPIYGQASVESMLAAPVNLKLTNTGKGIQVSWAATPNATAYEVYVNSVWEATTDKTSSILHNVNLSAQNTVHVIAISKEHDQLNQVSRYSDMLQFNVDAEGTAPGAGSGTDPGTTPGTDSGTTPESGHNSGSSSGSTSSSGTTTARQKPSDNNTQQLTPSITMQGNIAIAQIPAGAVTNIEASKALIYQIDIPRTVSNVEVNIPARIIQAIMAKGDAAKLAVLVNAAVIHIPIHALHGDGNLRLNIADAAQSDASKLALLAEAEALKLLGAAVRMEAQFIQQDGTAKELDFSRSYATISTTLAKGSVNSADLTGAVYIPALNQLWPVPTWSTANADGSVVFTSKLLNNGIFTLVSSSNIPFKDMTTSWSEQDIRAAWTKRMVTGVNDQQFGGANVLQRDELAGMIIRALGILPVNGTSTFVDGSAEIEAAKLAGLMKGKSDQAFDPNGAITRQDLAVVLANILTYAAKTSATDAAALNSFNDQSRISAYAREAMALLVQHKIMLGVSHNQLDPRGTVTKEQAVVALLRTLRFAGLSN